MKFFDQVGKVALGSRVRFLGDKITEDAALIYRAYGIEMNPKWFPVFYVLSQNIDMTITAIADEIGHSHVSVSKISREMSKARLVDEKSDAKDKRRTMVSLSKNGKEIARKIEAQYLDVNAALDELSSEASNDLWRALGEWEFLLEQRSLLERVLEKKKDRESSAIKIVAYLPKYRQAFFDLNKEWITTYFKMEKPDRDALENPKEYILDRGGFIFVALLNKEPVGVCALIQRDDPIYRFELAKMAVSPSARGKNAGRMLGQSVIEKAKAMGAKRLFLESNTILKPAISLYHKLGFQKIVGPPTPYERCNIQMELIFR
jgi:DNA-binding MarR family transcriptional regulator/predicted GNAT family N-acyltransferase